MAKLKRRQFMSGVAGVAAAGSIGGVSTGRPSSAGGESVAYQTFTEAQAATFSAWCDHLAIGAAEAGVASFVDASISGPYEESRLMARFFVNPSLGDFYTAGIAGIDQEADARYGRDFVTLETEQQRSIVTAAATVQDRGLAQAGREFLLSDLAKRRCRCGLWDSKGFQRSGLSLSRPNRATIAVVTRRVTGKADA